MRRGKPPSFWPGANVAMKVPSHEFDRTVEFYRDIIRLPLVREEEPAIVFEFGDRRLWIDRADHLSHAEIWLELCTDDIQAAGEYLEDKGIVRRDEVEMLPDDFEGFWIANPANIIHLMYSD